jgi:murein DD-endopeptidase MepM/ murein hydrolase activator NlpD
MLALKHFFKSFHFLTITLFICLCLLFFTYLPELDSDTTLSTAKASISPDLSALLPGQNPTEPAEVALKNYTEFHGVIRPGDNLARSFSANAIPIEVRQPFIDAFKDRLNFNKLQPGDQYSIFIDAEGQIVKGVYQTNPFTSYTAIATPDGLQVSRDEVQLDLRQVSLSGSVTYSLFEAFPDNLQNQKPIYAFADIFASKLDFNTETRKGDSFSLIIDEYYRSGEFVGYGPILAARYEKSDGEVLQAYRFSPDGKKFSYYDAEGKELGASFIRSPVPMGRVSSRFSHRRLHPVLGVVRQHLGVDLAAPTGTPIMAAADGRVLSIGTNGGFGKQIVLAHGNEYRTYYGHLSKFKPGLRVGSQVKQKQIIGYVGSTGLSTGPHLDYRLQQHGTFKNPFALKFQPKSTLAGSDLLALGQTIAKFETNLLMARADDLIEVGSLTLADGQQLSLL